MNLLTSSTLNLMRGALYGQQASLTFYKITPAAGESEIFSTRSGWHAQRDNSTTADRNGNVNIWLSAEVTPWKTDHHLHVGTKVTISAKGRTFSYRVASLKPMQQLGAGWVLNCQPVENSTEPANG